MQLFVLWCVFVGSWLLVLGPAYQAALELGEDEEEMARLRERAADVPAPAPLSKWWWLLPPVRFVLSRRRSDAYRRALSGVFTDQEYATVNAYVRRAIGWFLVGTGGFLHAVYETYHVTEHYDWPVAIFWLITLGLLAFCLAAAGGNQARAERRRPNVRGSRRAEHS